MKPKKSPKNRAIVIGEISIPESKQGRRAEHKAQATPSATISPIRPEDIAIIQDRIDNDPAVHSAFVALFRSHIRRQRAEAAAKEAEAEGDATTTDEP